MCVHLPSRWRSISAVLVHDWLNGMRGGEKCLELLCDGFPSAPVYTLVYEPDRVSEAIRRHPVHPSPLQRVPAVRDRFRWFLPFFPTIIERMSASPAELMISTSHCVAKGLPPPDGARHLCYCFTPMRYPIFYREYFGGNPLKALALRPVLEHLRRWDRESSDRVDRFVAISRHVRERIRRFYDRDADIVYPPVNTDWFTPAPERKGGYDLVVSALVPYKAIHLAVEAYNRLGFPLRIVGTGSEYRRLRARARPHIEFLGWQSDDAVREHYRSCRFLVFPGEEDFGIVPLEAQACGAPVIAFGRGGALETIVPGETGLFFDRQGPESLLAALEEAAGRTWNPARIRANAERFRPQGFVDGMDRCIRELLGERA